MKNNTFKEIREESGMNKAEFAKHFNIPYRTVQNWELGLRPCPEYILDLINYRLVNERKLRLMKFYQIITISMQNNEPGDEFTVWEGFDYDEAVKQKEKAEQAFNALSDYDKKRQAFEARVYDLELTENPDADEINDAIIESLGYNEF